MAGRMLDRSIATDDRLNSLSDDAMLLYLMVIPHLDKDGLIDGRPPVLWATVAPLKTRLQPVIGDLIDEWAACGLVVCYEGNRTPVLWFTGFAKNQSFEYKKGGASKFPPPPGFYRSESGLKRCENGDCASSAQVGKMSSAHPEHVDSKSRVSSDLVASRSLNGRSQVQVQDQVQTEHEVEEEHQDKSDLTVAKVVVGASMNGKSNGVGVVGSFVHVGSIAGDETAIDLDVVRRRFMRRIGRDPYMPNANWQDEARTLQRFSVDDLGDEQLAAACSKLASWSGVVKQFNGMDRWLAGLSRDEVEAAARWLFRWFVDEQSTKGIRNLAAVLRVNVRELKQAFDSDDDECALELALPLLLEEVER